MEKKRLAVCGVCGARLNDQALLEFKNMPAAAQHLPDAGSLNDDAGQDLVVSQCSGCGLAQLNNEPVPYYREVIRANAFSPEMREFRMKQFSDFINDFSLKSKKLIEIGCGRGENLALISRFDCQAYGLEYAEASVKECQKNGLKVQAGFIEDENYVIDGAPFEAFIILSFLEHWPRPNRRLKGIGNNLKDGAVGIVEVPNFEMILKKKLFSEFIADHLFYFTKDTLETVLKLSGFEVLACREVWHDYIISATVRKRRPLDLADFSDRQAVLKNQVDAYLARFKNQGVAIWGAGHQALALIALLNIADRIKYVVDSATFKQNKYTPATHLPIVPPEKISIDPVGAIVVMAGSYSDEVAKIIRAEHGGKINVAVMRAEGLEISGS